MRIESWYKINRDELWRYGNYTSHEITANYSGRPRLWKHNDSSVMNLRTDQYGWCIVLSASSIVVAFAKCSEYHRVAQRVAQQTY